VSIFLAATLFVFTFVPGLLEPFALDEEENTVLTNRLADRLAKDTLGNSSKPFVLDTPCAVSFFDESKTPPDRCRYDGGTLSERLNVKSTTNVNVTIERNVTVGSAKPDTLCWDGTASDGDSVTNDLIPADDSACDSSDTTLTIGETPSRGTSTITARRVVSMDGEAVTLKVVVW